MATTVVKTIGTGGDYSTVQAWEDACPADLVAADQIWQGQLKNQEFVASSVLTVSGQTADSTRYVELTTEAGASFADHANKATNPLRYDASVGAAIRGTGSWVTTVGINTGYTRLTKLQIYGAGANSIVVHNNGGTIDRCIVEQAQAREALFSDGSMNVINSVIIARAAHHGVASAFGGTIYGCTFIGSGGGSNGIRNNYGTFTVKNTYVGGFGATTGAGGTKSVSNSYTSESGPPSGWSGTVALSTSTFENVTFTTHDYRLKSGSGLINVGADEASYTTDIIGTARSSGSYDVGAWEFASSGPTSAITATTANSVGSLTSKSSPLSSIAATTASLAAAWSSTVGVESAIAATTAAAVGALTSTGSTGNGTFTSEVLRDNTGTIVASKALNHVALYNDTTGALVVRKTGLSTNGSGIFTFTDAAITAGTTYRVDWEDVDGRRRMPRKAAT